MDEKDMNDLNILGGFLKLGTDRVYRLRHLACPCAPDTRLRLRTIATAMLFACMRVPPSPALHHISATS